MDDDRQIPLPQYIIGRHSEKKLDENPKLKQQFATCDLGPVKSLAIFTDIQLAQQFMNARNFDGYVVTIRTRAELLSIIDSQRRMVPMVSWDPVYDPGMKDRPLDELI